MLRIDEGERLSDSIPGKGLVCKKHGSTARVDSIQYISGTARVGLTHS